MKKDMIVVEGKKIMMCVVAAFLYAVGMNLFIVPTGLYSGGVMGISQVIRTVLTEYLHLNFNNFDIAGVIYYIINIPIFLLAFARLGRKFFAKTLIMVTSMTLFLSVIPVSWVICAPRLRPGFTNVTYLLEMTPSTTFKAAISVIFSCFGSSPVVSRSRAMYEFVIILHFLLFFAARAVIP